VKPLARERDVLASLLLPVQRGGLRLGGSASVVLHTAIVSALVLVPLLSDEAAPDVKDAIRVAFYIAPPPPPPPPPAPAGLESAAKPRIPVPDPEPPDFVEPEPENIAPNATAIVDELSSGMAGGAENGVVGGMEGGVTGGVLGGVDGGVGGDPVLDFDRGPRLLQRSQPRYPDEAFVRKIQGTVVLEILIDVAGRVARARVVQSMPLLDAAAIETVRQWVFAPAVKNGRPVATLAMAPVTFTIY
jgi:protein TonB